ncbi:MAG TPA: TraB/GumN family protein [Steroidobacteraceae bacterium]|nr:TraB/GumN family protein [Steroidobacteraceae bacterium]
MGAQWSVPVLCLAACFSAGPAFAQAPTEPGPGSSLDEIVVTGEFPGPGMWKVTRSGDTSGHVLWIVGDPWVLPKRWQWRSRDIEAKARSAQAILFDSAFSVTPDEKIGLLRGLTLAPAIIKARRNPDGATLADLLPPAMYARWLVQKKLYLGRESGVEKWRPLFAAQKLLDAAFDELDLQRGTVSGVVRKLATRQKIKVTVPLLEFKFQRAGIRDRIKEFARESLADQECLRATLDLTEALARRDIESARARAWATGDLAALTALPELPNPGLPCATAIASSQVAHDLVPPDIRERLLALWMTAAETSFGANETTLAVVPFAKLTRADGYIDRLRARGYAVDAPE